MATDGRAVPVHELFAAQAARTPDRVAVVYAGGCLSYRELDARAGRLARSLRASLGGGELVAVIMERAPEMVVAILGALEAGAAYLPLDPAHPRERLAALLDEARAPVVLTQERLVPRLPAGRWRVLALDGACETAGEREADPGLPVEPAALAYAIYTSGSTGRPKGVLVPHGALANHMLWMQREFPLGPDDGVVQKTPITFDAAVWELFAPLLAGARLVLAPPDAHQDAAGLARLTAREGATVLQMVPAGLRALLDQPEIERCRSLRRVFCGGETLSPELAERCLERLGAVLVNLYGPTEACIDSTFQVCARGMRTVPIGRPIAHTWAYVLDRYLDPAAEGEIHVAGRGLARGYLGRPELTAERFLPDPFAAGPGERMYATGDLARRLPGGKLEILGRADDQVKVRGYRVEPAEVEAALHQLPPVRECAVAARPGPGGEAVLAAYVAFRQGAEEPTVSALRAALRETLPDFMVPSAFVFLDGLPRTPSGKVDRRRLPAPGAARPALAVPFVAPRTEEERRVAEIWAGLLGLDRAGALDGFFELGGHSLAATQVISRVRAELGVEVPLRALFEAPTVAGLAERIAAARRQGGGVAEPPPGPVAAEPPPGSIAPDRARPLSFAQQRLWFLDQLEPGSPLYNMPATLRLRGPLDVPALARSLEEIVRRHEVLRTAFPGVDGKPVAVVAAGPRLALAVDDLADHPAADRWQEALARVRQEAQAPFDLARGPLVRARLLRLGAADHVLLLTFHHIVTDGWSEGVFYRELAALYEAFTAGGPSPLPDQSIQYADFAAWQRGWLQGETLAAQLAFWRQTLAGAPTVLEVPADRPRPTLRSHRGARLRVEISGPVSEALRALGREAGATPFMTALAAFAVLLQRYTGQDEMLLGTPVANRNRLEIEGLIGFFVNTLVVRCDLAGDPPFRTLLRRLRGVLLGAYAYQDLPFEKLVEELRPPRDLGRTALFQVMVAHAATPRVSLAGLAAEHVDVDDGIAKFDLTLEVDDSLPTLAVALEYSTDLFDAATAGRMLANLETLLAGIAAGADRPLSRLPLLAEGERRILAEWSGGPAEPPPGRCLHELLAEQAARTPDAVAVELGDERLTYAGLERRASALAGRLRRLGVGPESPVGLCVERSVDMVAGLLGILLAGGAYVPLDPGYPRELLAHIVKDAGIQVMLARRRLLEDLPAGGARVVCLEDPADADDLPGAPTAVPANLAYVLYTSGSTGVPKGVPVPHRALVNHCVEMARRYGLGPADRVLQFASLSFDVAAEEIFPALLRGAAVVLRPDPVFVAVPDFHRFLADAAVTLVNLPSSYWHAWVAELSREEHPLPACLRCVVIGSEKALAGRLAAWQEVAGDRLALFDAYGPTEATITTTLHRPERGRPHPASGLVPVGRPIANARVHVLDRHGNPAPVGAPGELRIGGMGLARGYLGRPDATAERFAPDPFSPAPGARLYRTGDRARWLASGDLEVLGRLDDQVKVRGHRIEPGEIERALARHPAVAEAVVLAREDAPGEVRLVAYVAPRAGAPPTTTELRAHLNERLPEPMLPAVFVILERLPRTPGGKVDRQALPAPDPARRDLAGEPAAPRTAAEATLARIWAQVFGREHVGVDDNFFELGGDSILSIQIVARANQAGLRLTSRQVFQHQTVAELAAAAGTRGAAPAEQGAVTGEAELTPIQRWFFEHGFADPHHFNQAVLLAARQELDPARLAAALGLLLAHHDALRLRFRRTDGEWRQSHTPPGAPVPCAQVDLSALPEERRLAAMAAAAAAQQRSLDLGQGPLLRAALFGLGPGSPARLLIAVHHLVVDGVSWRILLEDLNTAYRQLERGDSLALPAKTTSYRRWAERLAGHARSSVLDRELGYWLAEARRRPAPVPVDFPEGDNSEGSARVAASTFTEDETRALLEELPAAWRTGINDVLLTALALAVAGWTGERRVLIDLEGHGREEIFDDVDLSRTVGWFTTIKPVLLEVEPGGAPAEALKAVKERLRAMPARGIGYGLLRYLRDDRELAALPPAEISFNYLGQFDAAVPASAPFRFAAEQAGPVVSPRARRTHLLEVGGYVASGRLRVHWKYGERVHRRATVEALARRFEQALRALIALANRPGSAAWTPSDFPLARLGQATLDLLARDHPDLQDLYPLTPIQEGMLYHALAAPESGIYVEHLAWKLHGPLDEEAFRRAWQLASDRHTILRTALVWEGMERPLQVVRRSVELRWERRDWRGLDADGQERALRDFLAADLRRGFDLARPPLQRFALMRLAGGVHQFVWSHHHVLLDGWSLPVLLQEVMALYQALRAGEAPHLEEPEPFRDYVAWLLRQDLAAAEAYWRRALAGFTAPTPLAVDRPASHPARPEDHRRQRLPLPAGLAAELQAFARRHGLTLHTVLQGAWAILLGRYSGESDVVVGGVVSGRPADLEGAERRVGLFLNTLPVRARLPGHEPVVSWLRRLQDEQVEMRQHEHTPLDRIQEWSEVAAGRPLFESVFAFENYPLDPALLERMGDLAIRDLRAVEWTHYPLGLVVPPGLGLSLDLNYEARRFAEGAIERMLGHLKTLLEGIAADPRCRLADLPMLTAAERALLAAGVPRLGEIDGCLTAAFEAQAARKPDAVALVCADERLTYAGLNRRANRLARRLRALGVGPEARVALCLERSNEMVAAILAVLKAGGAYVPLDPAYPRERLAFMLDDAGVAALIAERPLLARLPELVVPLVPLDLPEAEDDGDLPLPALPASPAYVIYTSGSTGRPKGVVVTHANTLSLFAATAPELGFSGRDVWTLLHSYAFDYSVWEMWGALLHGGRLVVVPSPAGQSPAELLELVGREQVTVLNLTPAELRQIVREDEAGAPCLRLVDVGGEALHPEDVKPWLARHPERPRLVNLYGITETTVIVTSRPLGPRDVEGRPRSLIGQPLAHLAVRLLAAGMQPAPVGVAGEIHVGGAGLARGYLGRPDLTAERFVPDPFAAAPGARLYRSGDLARRLEDGDLEYLGRLDDQVKIRGFRIEPAEVEAALLAHPAVREAVVLARQDGGGERRLVAYVVPRPGAEPAAGELRAALRQALPDPMVPAAFVVLAALPVTPNGKIDRRALPAPESARSEAVRVPPRTPIEEELAELWGGLLGVEEPSVEEDFFAAGGQSLQATRLVSRVRAQLGAEVSLKDFLDEPTIRGLAGRVEAAYLLAADPSELDALLGLMETRHGAES